MTIRLLLLSLILLTLNDLSAQNEFELKPSQSMLMTGKGYGQDGTINPYDGQNCYAIIENIGKREFSIRIQKKGKIIASIPIDPGDIKKVKLLKGHELYLDSNPKGTVNAKISYEKMEDQ